MSIKIDVEEVVTKTTKFKGAELNASTVASWVKCGPANERGVVRIEYAPNWSANGLRELSEFASQVADAVDAASGEKPAGTRLKITSPAGDYLTGKEIEIEINGFGNVEFDVVSEDPSYSAAFTLRRGMAKDLRDKLTALLGE